MQFPPEWSFADVANLEAYQYSRMEDRKPGMEIIVHFVDGKAGDFRIVLGGASIVSMKFDGSKIFGPRFEGKKLLLKANITPDIPELTRIRTCRIRLRRIRTTLDPVFTEGILFSIFGPCFEGKSFSLKRTLPLTFRSQAGSGPAGSGQSRLRRIRIAPDPVLLKKIHLLLQRTSFSPTLSFLASGLLG
jgi:hypothetical protein